jgi:very-short-patch-repair endonuclease
VRRSALVEPVTVAGIRVNSIAQALIDVAGRVDERRLGRAFGDAVTSGRLDVSALAERFVLVAHSRRPGIGAIRVLLEQYGDGEAPAESALEAELLAAAAEAGLTGVVTQHPLPWWPEGGQRVDAFVPAARVILEADGRRWHTRVEDFDRDRWRDNQAVLHHWRPLRYTWHHLTRRRAEVVRDLRSLAVEIARASTTGFRGQMPERRPTGQPAVYSSPDGRSVTAARPSAPSAPSPSPAADSSSPRLASHSAGSIVSEE